ncbi:hypothetical protein QE400_000398 [Xanthomonas sacchari]|nr:hypothetical protein [Xanthomonas sacchari]
MVQSGLNPPSHTGRSAGGGQGAGAERGLGGSGMHRRAQSPRPPRRHSAAIGRRGGRYRPHLRERLQPRRHSASAHGKASMTRSGQRRRRDTAVGAEAPPTLEGWRVADRARAPNARVMKTGFNEPGNECVGLGGSDMCIARGSSPSSSQPVILHLGGRYRPHLWEWLQPRRDNARRPRTTPHLGDASTSQRVPVACVHRSARLQHHWPCGHSHTQAPGISCAVVPCLAHPSAQPRDR